MPLARLIQRAFDIREGELSRALLMQLNIFLIISTLLVVKPTANGLFLSQLGVEALPVAFVLVALFAVFISTIYTRVLGRRGLDKIITYSFLASILVFTAFGLAFRFNITGDWVLYAFYVWVAVFGVLTASQFWILANVVFNAREAKRLFGFIGAGAIAGGIFGGYLTTLLAEPLGSENLLFVGAGLLVFCTLITRVLWRRSVLPVQSKYERRKKIARPEHPFALIRRSAHLKYLAAIIGIGVIAARLVDYQFNAIASREITDPDELTAFFGFWFSNFNVISLLLQLLLTRRIVGVLGVGTSLLFLPVAIFIGALCVLFAPVLWAGILIKMSDSSLKQSINKAGIELLALPVPLEVKKQTKTFIDVVVDSIATGIGGLILIFLVRGFDLSTPVISLIIMALVACWLYFVLRVRTSYLQTFRLNLERVAADDAEEPDLSHVSIVEDLRQVLEAGALERVLFVLRKLKTRPDERLAEPIHRLLQHPAPEVVEEAVRNLYFLRQHDYREDIRPLMHHPDPRVRVAATNYMLRFEEEDTHAFIKEQLSAPDHAIRLTALISLAEESRDNLLLKQRYELRRHLDNAYHAMRKIEDPQRLQAHKVALLKAMGYSKMADYFPVIESMMLDPEPEVARAAMRAAGETAHPHFLPVLLQALGDEAMHVQAEQALIGYGPAVISTLELYLNQPDAQQAVIRHFPDVVEHLPRQAAVDLLFTLLQHKHYEVRLNALRSLNTMRVRYGHLNFHIKEMLPYLRKEAGLYHDTLSILYVQRQAMAEGQPSVIDELIRKRREALIALLQVRLDACLERIFRLIGLKYPPDDVISIYENLSSQKPDVQANALEYLDNLLDQGLKKVLIPLVETALLDALSEDALRSLKLRIPDEEECYRLLLDREDKELSKAVQALMDALSGRS
ncbi:MAG: Npt1/Npt2 family nucleotide transporter [Saprospiraceae bacterium]|nr:Npt1/Npt2 family nucleotide transporter [Saprospiraceae bacterium]